MVSRKQKRLSHLLVCGRRLFVECFRSGLLRLECFQQRNNAQSAKGFRRVSFFFEVLALTEKGRHHCRPSLETELLDFLANDLVRKVWNFSGSFVFRSPCRHSSPPGGLEHCLVHGRAYRLIRSPCRHSSPLVGLEHCLVHGRAYGLLRSPCRHSSPLVGLEHCLVHGRAFMDFLELHAATQARLSGLSIV
jgi:hypothetical protein